MADKTYKLTLTLSNGATIDAGTFVSPQGPQGPQGQTTGATDRYTIKSITTTGTDNAILMCVAQSSTHTVFVGTAGISGDTMYFQCGSNKSAAIASTSLYPVIAYNNGQNWFVWFNGTLYTISGTDALYLNSDSVDDRLTIKVYGKEIN